ARKRVEEKVQQQKTVQDKLQKQITLEDLQKQIAQGALKELRIILKTDSVGSQEAIKAYIEKINAKARNSEKPGATINFIHFGLGAVNESDVLLAVCSNALIVGYSVGIDSKAEKLAKQQGVEIKIYRLVYDLLEDLKNTLEGMIKPPEVEVMIGQALVKQVFKMGKNQSVAGCIVVEGKVTRDAKVKIVRDGRFIFEGFLTSLKRFKNSVREVAVNTECGIGISDFDDFQPGDIIQVYQKVPEGTKV
ncbi:MAG TPA: translation initiation factor IF-2, partial [bacterium]|nr:translation initiation factor IF-2 [bacterium]